uniref:AB hydrolase-1 domain-containing protein n=1 Tax=Hyaloperonospora arabidopsidis (strain Emoy2) TaxID=559515 RepID=M4BKP0_HYAAE
MLLLRPLRRHVSTTPAAFRRLQLSIDTDGSLLSALAPVSVTPSQQPLLCLPSLFGSVARDFHRQLANQQLTRSWALYGLDLRLPTIDQDFSWGRRGIERDAEDVVRAADALELETFSLLGASHGANVSAVVAAKYPERVARLVLVNGNAFVGDEDLEDLEEHSDVQSWDRERRETAEAKCGAEDLQEKWTHMVEALRQVERDDGGDLYCGHLPHIKCKTLVVGGGQDKFVPLFHSEYLSERIMHSRLEIVPEGGNDLVLSKAEDFNKLLETFLQEPDDKHTQSREFVAVPSKMAK